MRIGIDCRTMLNPAAGERAGVGMYTFELVRALLQAEAQHYVLFFDHNFSDTEKVAAGRAEVAYFPEPHPRIPVVHAQWQLARFFGRYKLDVLHAPAYTFPLLYRGKTVVTVHDLAIYAQPQWFPPGQWWATKVVVPRCSKRADRVIAVSEATRADVLRLFHVAQRKVTTIYEGQPQSAVADPAALPAVLVKHGVRQPYFLFIGTIEPRKNLIRLVRAFERFTDRVGPAYQLVLAGATGWRFRQIMDAIQASRCAQQIRYVGYVSAADKRALLQGATSFVFPSLYEGFGLPLLEAMAAGTPIITSELSATREVAGDAAWLVDPYQEDEIVAALQRLASDEAARIRLAAAGKERLHTFSWQHCAAATLSVYHEIAGL